MIIKNSIPLSNFTTWKVGGPAEWLVEAKNPFEIKKLIYWAKQKSIPYQIIGAGSNLLISDEGIKGLTICMRKMNGYKIDSKNGIVEALAGEALPNLARKVAKQGLHGLEWAVGIPGTIGGAAVMNAGAQGFSTSDRLISVTILSKENGKCFDLVKDELDYSYRNSLLQNKEFIVLSARFQLEATGDTQKVIDETNNNLNRRLKTQPYHLPSCGSVFRNPGKLKAGRIIEEIGLKGFRKGGAEVSSIHANFIVNKQNATANDIIDLIKIIQNKVLKKHGFLLHPEVKRLGFEEIS